jgi:fructokinase
VCFGEVLWDCLPKGLFLGGAPINAAYHLSRQGLNVLPLTAVGRDFLGDEVIRRVANWGVTTKFIARDSTHPTGTVSATLDAAGIATYQIRRDVAWDYIPASTRLRRIQPQPSAIVFGTLALRGVRNRTALKVLLSAWPSALRVVDLNFRAPFDTQAVVEFALQNAQLVKLNGDELSKLTGEKGGTTRSLERGARRLAESYGCDRVCVTAGDRGAGLWWDGKWFWEAAKPVLVRDTVGSGDAFLGALLGQLLLKNANPARALARACRMGEFIASQDGATPDYRLDPRGRPVPRQAG